MFSWQFTSINFNNIYLVKQVTFLFSHKNLDQDSLEIKIHTRRNNCAYPTQELLNSTYLAS